MSNVQELLQQAKADAMTAAPPMRRGVEDVVAAGKRRRDQQRLLKAGAALVTAAAVTAAIALPKAFAGDELTTIPATAATTRPAAPAVTAAAQYPTQPFAWGFNGWSAGPFTVSAPVLVTPGYQEMYVRRGAETLDLQDAAGKIVASGPTFSALVTVYRPGVYNPSRFAGAKSVTVNGRPGRYGSDVPYHEADRNDGGGPKAAVAWQYADNAWAVVTTVTPPSYTEAELLQIAAGLEPAPATPATTALKLTWTPPGYTLTSGGATDDYPSGAAYMVANLTLVQTRPAYTGLTEPVHATATKTAWVRVSLYPVEFTDESHQKRGQPATCNPGNRDLCYRMSVDGKWLYEVYSSGALAQDDLRHMLDAALVADPHQPAAWYPLG